MPAADVVVERFPTWSTRARHQVATRTDWVAFGSEYDIAHVVRLWQHIMRSCLNDLPDDESLMWQLTDTHALVKTAEFEAIRLCLMAGKELREHKVEGSITLQCLEGSIDFRFGDEVRTMTAGDWLYLDGGVIHSLSAHENSSLLLTIMLREGMPA